MSVLPPLNILAAYRGIDPYGQEANRNALAAGLMPQPQTQPQGGGWDRDMVLPFARQTDQRGNVLRGGGMFGSDWHFAAPQFVADIANAAVAMRNNVFSGKPITTDEMIGHAGAVVGPMAGVGMTRVMMAPRGSSELGIFGGRLAKTADHAALARAEQMAAQGVPREQIWNETGWFQGVDGKWRFEIDDSGFKFTPGRHTGIRSLGMTHEALSASYPETTAQRSYNMDIYPEASRLANFGPDVQFGGGGTDRTGNVRMVATEGHANKSSDMLHELQHGAQIDEGFARGGSPKEFERGGELNSERGWFEAPADAYRRLSGEVEARAVQARQNLTADQRRARPPWLDYDVQEGKQIVRFR